MVTATQETDLLHALKCAETSGDIAAIESAVSELSLYYAMVAKQFVTAVPYWRRGADILATTTAPDSRELGCYLHNMAELCLIPAKLFDEAHATLTRSRELYLRHFSVNAECLAQVEELLRLVDMQRSSETK